MTGGRAYGALANVASMVQKRAMLEAVFVHHPLGRLVAANRMERKAAAADVRRSANKGA